MVVIIFVVCFLATIAGAITGIGGGIIIKPVIELTGIMQVGELSFLSGLTVLAMTGVNVVSKGDRSILRERTGIVVALGAAVGGALGKYIFNAMGAGVGAGLVQAITLGVLTLMTIVYVFIRRRGRIRTLHVQSSIVCALVGLSLGIFSAFLGIGGGPINIMALSYLFSLDTKSTGAHSLLIIFFSQLTSFISTLITGQVPTFSWTMLLVMVAAGVTGGILGSRMRARFNDQKTDEVFMRIMVAIFIVCVVNAARYLGALS